MVARNFTLMMGFLAATCFVALPGCQEPASTTTVSDAADGDAGHGDAGHGDDGHGDDGHDHDGEHGHDEHDGHDHDGEEHSHDFKSLSEAVEEIEELRDVIRDEFAAGHADEAHDPLHHIGEVLIATDNLIKSMDDSEQKTAAAAAVESLLDDFTAVDQGMHGSEESQSKGKKYADVSKSVDEAIETLKKGSE